jgi:RyR domain
MNINFEDIARICHEANRAYCISIGDNSQPPWEWAPAWQRTSAINGVKSHFESNLTPKQSHELWLQEKEWQGWKYGEVKDVEKKEHPCFMPYDQLPLEQQLKDSIFSGIVEVFKKNGAVHAS